MTENKLTPTAVRNWMSERNHDRPWLAETLGVSKRTVDNWFTDGELPLFASQHIRRIMCEEASPANLRFTLEQWDKIEAARLLAGYEDRTEFFTDALTHYAESLTGKVPDFVEKLGAGAVIRQKLSRLVDELREQHVKPRPASEPPAPDAAATPPRKRRRA